MYIWIDVWGEPIAKYSDHIPCQDVHRAMTACFVLQIPYILCMPIRAWGELPKWWHLRLVCNSTTWPARGLVDHTWMEAILFKHSFLLCVWLKVEWLEDAETFQEFQKVSSNLCFSHEAVLLIWRFGWTTSCIVRLFVEIDWCVKDANAAYLRTFQNLGWPWIARHHGLKCRLLRQRSWKDNRVSWWC